MLTCHIVSHLPPAICATTLLPQSLLQPSPHPNRSCCAVCISSPTLVTFSARCRYCCRNPLLALTALVAPSTARSCCTVPPLAQQRCPHRCHCDVPMQKLGDADVDVNVGVDCVCLASSTVGGAALSHPFPCCFQRLLPPLLLLSLSLCCSHHCCHPYNCGADAAR